MPTIRTRHSSRVAESWQNFVTLIATVSGGSHDHAFRQALFTAVGQFFLIIVLLVGYQVYFILHTFLKPLAWAALTGTILFPLKNFLAKGARGWIQDLKSSSTTLVVGLGIIPFKLVDHSCNLFGTVALDFVWNYYMKILWCAGGLISCFLAQLILWHHMDVIVNLSTIFGGALSFFSSKAIWFLIFPYILAVNYLWTPEHRKTLRILAWPLWIWLGLHLSSLLGSLAAPILLIVAVVLCLGFSAELKTVQGRIQRTRSVKSVAAEMEDLPDSQGIVDTDKHHADSSYWNWKVVSSSLHHLLSDSLVADDAHGEEEGPSGPALGIPTPSLKLFAVNNAAQGTRYMLYLFWMFILVEILSHYYIIPFLLIPVAYRVIRVCGQQRGAWTALANYMVILKNRCKGWVMMRKDIVAPAALRGLVRLAKQGDQKLLSLLEDTIDETVSLLLVLMMFFAMTISGIIATMQVQQETIYLVGLSSDFMNQTIVSHPEYLEWLPEGAQVQETMQTAMDGMYLYARDWVVGTMRDAIADANATRVALIEKDILSIADRVYQFYMPRNSSSQSPQSIFRQSALWGNRSLQRSYSAMLAPDDDDKRWSFHIWSQLNETWHKASGALDWSSVTAYLKNNIDTFSSVFESVWTICKGNFTLLFSLVTTVMSILIVYFSAFLHFIFCGFVYIAALYYLLCSSKDRYRPLELIGVISPYIAEAGHVAEIIEQTINDIFAASFKMAAFYGFFTWVLLSLFGIYIKFIPSVLASLLAVCPLVPPYVVCIPALCELWFLRGEYIPAIFLVVGACLPSMFVDIAIYGDVKSAHPYMFGLSVAGGLVTMGLEGAVFGPVMLCILVVAVQVYRRILQPTTRNSVPNLMDVLSSNSATTPDTPNAEITVQSVEFGRQESITSYPSEMLEHAEKDSSVTPATESKAEIEVPSSSRRRINSASRKQSTPKEGLKLSPPNFNRSPISPL